MNAIILAAGQGTRLRPLTDHIPKPLVAVHGEPIIERQIRFLNEAGIRHITVVTGYRGEQLEYLREKFGVHTLHNPTYNEYNNIYSMYLARDLLGNTLVLEGDVFLPRNIFTEFNARSAHGCNLYFTGPKFDFASEWILRFDANKAIYQIDIMGGSGSILSGVSYWSLAGARTLRDALQRTVASENFAQLFWDDLIRQDPRKYNVYAWPIEGDDWFEIDSVADHAAVEARLLSLGSYSRQ